MVLLYDDDDDDDGRMTVPLFLPPSSAAPVVPTLQLLECPSTSPLRAEGAICLCDCEIAAQAGFSKACAMVASTWTTLTSLCLVAIEMAPAAVAGKAASQDMVPNLAFSSASPCFA